MTGRRLDAELVARGLARSRGQARELIDAGVVRVDGTTVTKAAHPVRAEAPIDLDRPPDRWVGRAALKLVEALRLWGPDAGSENAAARGGQRTPARGGGGASPDGGGDASSHGGIRALDPRGKRCLDVGASTGGFTQVLLERGAAHVTALDVGHGQLVRRLAEDPRVRDLPGTNIRDVTADELGGAFDLVVADLSFISLTTALPPMAGLVAPDGELVVLVKPQFEVGRERLGRGGVVRSAHEHARVLREVRESAVALGLLLVGAAPSPIEGGEGNREFLFRLVPTTLVDPQRPPAAIDNDMLDAIAHPAAKGAS